MFRFANEIQVFLAMQVYVTTSTAFELVPSGADEGNQRVAKLKQLLRFVVEIQVFLTSTNLLDNINNKQVN